MKKRLLLLISAVLAVMVLIAGSAFGAEDADAATDDTQSLFLTFPTQEEVVTYAQEHPPGETYFDKDGNMLKDYEISYDEKPKTSGTYSAGSLALSEQVSALNTVRLIRYIAGLSESVYLFDPYTDRAQAAALLNYVNGKASHSPKTVSGMSQTLTADALLGASDSNIDYTSWKNNSLKSSIIYAWMYDSDSSNISTLGHRRWILNPSLVMTGFGSVTGSKGTFNTMYIRNESKVQESSQVVCWPAGNTPISYFDNTYAWSISVGEEVDEDSVSVMLIRASDYKMWKFTPKSSKGELYVNNQNYGQPGCIIFKPSNIANYKAGDTFWVHVEYNNKEVDYDVNFFDLEGYYSPSKASMKSVKIGESDQPAIEWTTVKDADCYDLYRKAYDGSWKLIAEDLDEPYFDDATAVAGIKYCYRVVAKRYVNGTAYESKPCGYKSVTMPLSKPSIKVSSASKYNYLSWKKVSKATGYKIYRRVYGTSMWKLVKTTKNLAYVDYNVGKGTTYQYKVRAYRTTYGNTVYSSYSSSKSVKTR